MKYFPAVICLFLSCMIPPNAIAQNKKTNATHGLIFYNKENFAGWPANEGIWTWDHGREILVGFEVSGFQERDDTHNVDRHSPKRVVFARSFDGGKTWNLEEHPEIRPPKYIGEPTLFDPQDSNTKKTESGINFTHPDFAMKLRNDVFYFSYDRGKNWQGPYQFPHFNFTRLLARPTYIIDDCKKAKFFFSVSEEKNGNHNRTLIAETMNGGLSFNFKSWVAPGMKEQAPDAKNTFSTMPSAIRLPSGRLIVALRQRIDKRKWTDIYSSDDDGQTWQFLSTPEKGGSNPPALVHLGGNRIAHIYGARNKPLGIRGQISEDGGETWSEPYILRDDAYEWDFGYVRAALADDGHIVAVYYYTTQEHREQHIAFTRWQIPSNTTN